jgi:TP901 family phage tail tape measure protein
MALNSSNFQILVNAVLDAKNIQAQLDKISQKYATMKVGIDVDTSKLSDALSGLKGLKVGFDDTSTSAEKTSQSIGDIFTKVSKFGGVTLVINELRQSLMEGVDAVRELDAAVTEYKKVSDLTDEGMKSFVSTAREMGLEVGKSATEFIEAGTQFKKMGYSDQESLQLGKVATMFQNIADTAISAGDSASFVNSQMKAFNMTAEDAQHIIDVTNEVANNMAVGTNDLAKGLTVAGAGLSVLGNDFEQSIALITSGTEILTGRSAQVARGLTTIGNNIAKAANEAGELSFKVQGVTKSIDLFDKSTGEMKSTYQVFQDLKSSWDDMSQAEKQSLGLALAGKNQFSVFNSVMLNLNSATEAYKIALDSQGSALKENARYLDSIQGKVSQFTSELEKFWTEGISSDSVKRLVEFGTQVLKLINDLGGMPTVLTAITGAFITLNGHKVPEMIAKISTNVLDMIAKFDYAYAATGSLAQGFTAMAGAGSLLTASLGAVSLVVTGLVAAYGYYNTQQENARRAAEQAGSSFEDERKNLYNLRLEYINAKDAASNEDEDKQKLKSTISKLAKAYGVEEEALSNLNGTRAEGLDLLSKENAEKSQDFLNRNQAEIQKAQKATQDMLNRTSFYIPLKFTSDTESSESFKAFYNKYTKSLGEGVYEAAGGYKELIADLNTTITAMQQEDNQTKLHQQTLAFLSNTLVELEDKYNKTATLTREAADATVDVDKKTQSFINTQYDSLSSFESVYNALLKNNSQIPLFKEALDEVVATQFPDFAKALGIELQDNGDKAKEAADGVNQYGEDAGEAASQTEEFEKAIKSLTSELKGVQDAYDTLHEVADEYNKTGSVTIDTMADLLSLNPAYLESLQMVNGQLVVNDESLMSMAQSFTETGISAISSTQGLDVFSGSEQNIGISAETAKQGTDDLGTSVTQVGTASSQANSYVDTFGNTMITAGNKGEQGATGLFKFASGLAAISNANANITGGVGVKSYSEGFDAQVQAYQKQQNNKILEELKKNLQFKPSTSGGKSGKGGGGSKKSSTSDAEKQAKADAKAYKEAFEKELADLDKRKSTMKDNASTDKWYYEQLEELTNKYYKDKEGYEEEYNKYHEKALDGMTKAHDAAYTERYNLLKHQLAMDMISEQEYYDELEELMKEFYSNEEKYAEQRWKIEEEIYSGRNKLEEENTRKAEQEAEKRKKARKEEWEEEKAWYEEQQSNLETAFSYVASLAQKEIDALSERKQAIQDQYDAEIDKINEKNDATNDEIELQEKLDALAKAQQKKVRIYREGQGFVYETDQSAVDEAKTALTQYKKEQDTKKEIKRLEDIRDATINSVEEQIKYWQKYKDEWGNVTDNYTTEQNKLLAEQVLGISLEGENWEKRLGNLQDYVDRYNEIMSTLKTRYKSYDDDDDEDFGDELDPDEYYSDKEPSYSHGSGGDNWYEDDISHGPGAYANGTTKGYGLSMVGEKGRELRVLGSRSNEGDGIIPNHLTENLMQLGKFSPTQWLNSIIDKVGGQSTPVYNYAFDSLVLPNVTNAQSFIDELKNLKNRALQMGGRRD